MTHDEFVRGYRAGRISPRLDRRRARRLADRMWAGRRRTVYLYVLSNLAPLAAIALGVWVALYVAWWLGLAVLAAAPIPLELLVIRMARRMVLERALDDADFYRLAVESGVLQIEEGER